MGIIPFVLLCRDDWIRTSGLLHPMQTRYRAALRPEIPYEGCKSKIKRVSPKMNSV